MRAVWTMLLAAGPLALWGAWVLWVSIPHRQWLTGVLGGLALVTAGGVLFLKALARALGYLFSAGLVGSWFYAGGQVVSRGWPYGELLGKGMFPLPAGPFFIVCPCGGWV